MNLTKMFSIALLIGLGASAVSKLVKKPKPTRKMKILFVLKRRDPNTNWGNEPYQYGDKSSGLSNSVKFIVKMLDGFKNTDAKMVEVIDGNYIHAEIVKFKPNIVVYEALHCPPYKVAELKKLHPTVNFVLRLHSEIPFLSSEGIAMDYIFEYAKLGVDIAVNAPRIGSLLSKIVPSTHIKYLPNYYPLDSKEAKYSDHTRDEELKIAIPGAIRPLKNVLHQVTCAVALALKRGKTLKLYINSGRKEGGNQDSTIKNIKSLMSKFEDKGFQLIEMDWLDHKAFKKEMKKMDLVMQVSHSETFSICSADAISQLVPTVVSPEVTWASSYAKADPNNADDIISKMEFALDNRRVQKANLEGLKGHNDHVVYSWKNFFKNL